jgi:hypothetical protein
VRWRRERVLLASKSLGRGIETGFVGANREVERLLG